MSPRFVSFRVGFISIFLFFLSEQFRSKFMVYISKEHFSPCKTQDREKKENYIKPVQERGNFQRAHPKIIKTNTAAAKL